MCIHTYACKYFSKIDQLQSTVSAIHINASSGYKRVYEQPLTFHFGKPFDLKLARSIACAC